MYDNLVGLAASDVLTEVPSADELSEGLAHLGLHLKSEKELFACLSVIRSSFSGQAMGFREFLRALQLAQEISQKNSNASTSDHSESGSPTSVKLDDFDKWVVRSSSQQSDDDGSKFPDQPDEGRQASLHSPGELESLLEAEHRDVLQLLQKAGSKLTLLSQESLSTNSRKLCSQIQELVENALQHARAMGKSLSTATEALEISLSSAKEGIRRSQQLMSQGKEAADSLLERLKKAEADIVYWRRHARVDLEEVLLTSALPTLAKFSPGVTFNRLMRLAGAEAIAFAWFRASALLLPMRRRHLRALDQLAAAQCSERLRRRGAVNLSSSKGSLAKEQVKDGFHVAFLDST